MKFLSKLSLGVAALATFALAAPVEAHDGGSGRSHHGNRGGGGSGRVISRGGFHEDGGYYGEGTTIYYRDRHAYGDAPSYYGPYYGVYYEPSFGFGGHYYEPQGRPGHRL